MTDLHKIILYTLLAGGCIPLGGFLAIYVRFQPQWLYEELRHFVIALGGGVLLGAVALVLIPEGVTAMQHSFMAIPCVIAGGVTFFLIELNLGIKRREAPQLAGMLLDFIPESIALGGLLALKAPSALLLALLIGLQNLPEGFNTYRELINLNHRSPKRTLLDMCLLVILGPIAGLAGFFFLADHHSLLGAIMLFASGGILYLIFQDIAPQSRLNKHWAPPLGAVIGVSITLCGQLMLT